MTVDSVKYEVMTDSPAPEWTIRVIAIGSGFEARAVPLRATVGGTSIEGIIPSPDGASFVGYLREVPAIGATLIVSYHQSFDTGLTFQGTT